MTKHEEAAMLRACVQPHYNCAQAVLIPFAEDLGLSREQAAELTAQFGGGMGCGGTCGALAGAAMVLGGLKLPLGERKTLIDAFRTAHTALNCTELTAAAAAKGMEKKPHCDGLVLWCVDYLCALTGKE